ncbi:MAG: tRNA threonylcarbamoyladenosine biosynthesis protein TsaE [Candidatus Paceibacteria bacterium]|jgi:tRNA threonylcarbamoyladenosine biosynthesis protein TsaE
MEEQTFAVATTADFEPVILTVLSRVVTIVDQAAVVTLTGDLGAGKTTFTQQLALHLGIMTPVVSPTFGIMKFYELENHPHFDQLVHIDAYRIEDLSEVGPLRFEELFQTPRTLICLEWPENISEILLEEKVEVTIEIGEGEQRVVSVI